MSTFMLCFATIAMMAIGLGAIAVILGIAVLDAKKLLQSQGGIDKSKHRQSTLSEEKDDDDDDDYDDDDDDDN